MFFKHYVRIGEDSVFGRVSQYYGAVETNERGALPSMASSGSKATCT